MTTPRTTMVGMLARRTLGDRPRRTVVLLLGLGIAVGVMITLLSIGQAVLLQAEDPRLVGGGDLLLLPAGIDVEVMKIGGATGMFAMLDNARFLFRQLLCGPRFAATIAPFKPDYAALPLAAVSPALVEKVVYVRPVRPGAPIVKALAHGFIPSFDRAAGGPTAAFVDQGIPWRDSEADRMWVDPPIDSLYNDMDRFHLPARTLPGLDHWAEWLYFNFTDAVSGVFGYVSLIVGGDIEAGKGRGGPLVRIQRHDEPPLEFTHDVPVQPQDISRARVDLRLGTCASATFVDGAYRVHLAWEDERGPVRADLVVEPSLDSYYPPVLIHDSETFVSGYTVPALHTAVSGTIRAPGVALTLDAVPGYHDHNWGTWRSVSWEWGTASNATYSVLYGRVQHPEIDPGRAGAGIFLLLSQARTATARGGVLALFRPRAVEYEWGAAAPGAAARLPQRLTLATDARPDAASSSADAIRAALEVRAAATTPPRTGEKLMFVQLQGLYSVQAHVGGDSLRFEAPGFAEVFVPPPE